MSTNEPAAIEETVAPVKVNKFKEFVKSPKKIAIAVGATAVAVLAVAVFALKRSDEADFESEFPTEAESLEAGV